MAKGYNRDDANILCPYYVCCQDKSILCEGGIDPTGRTETRFHSKDRKREYMVRYCRSCFHACSLCKKNDAENGFERKN